jgi:hypothetical protein
VKGTLNEKERVERLTRDKKSKKEPYKDTETTFKPKISKKAEKMIGG